MRGINPRKMCERSGLRNRAVSRRVRWDLGYIFGFDIPACPSILKPRLDPQVPGAYLGCLLWA